MKTLVGVVGNYVEGDRFWGRETELARLLELIDEGAHVSIIAQRRIGKTSLMHEAANRLPPDFMALHIDVQAAVSAADMVTELTAATRPYASLWEKTKSIFSNIFKTAAENIEAISIHDVKIQVRAGLVGANWQEKGAQVLAALATHEKRVVLFIDELPIMVGRMVENPEAGKAEVDTLLSWLRARAIEHQGRINMVFAGSIGLEPVLNREGLSASANHLTPFSLDPWTDAVALGCLQALAAYYGIDLPKAAADRMLELLGCNIPHHVQMFFAKVLDYCQNNGHQTCPTKAIESIFEQKMLSTQGHAELVHMEERLKKVVKDDDLLLATDLLTQAAVAGYIGRDQMFLLCQRHDVAPREGSKVLPNLLGILEHDGYLKKDGQERYVFVSNLLRRWWRARFEAFYEKV